MDLNELRSNWNKSGTEKKNPGELIEMTKIQNHPKLNRIRIKFLIESVLLVLFLSFYNNMFDGENKPLWVNILLIFFGGLFILVDFLGYLTLLNPIKGDNLKESLRAFKRRLRRMAAYSVIASSLFGSTLILYFISTIDFTVEKYLMLGGMIITLFILLYLSNKNWQGRITQIGEVETNLGESAA